jgi:hypothetical protein
MNLVVAIIALILAAVAFWFPDDDFISLRGPILFLLLPLALNFIFMHLHIRKALRQEKERKMRRLSGRPPA